MRLRGVVPWNGGDVVMEDVVPIDGMAPAWFLVERFEGSCHKTKAKWWR